MIDVKARVLAGISLLRTVGKYRRADKVIATKPCATCGLTMQVPNSGILDVHPGCLLSVEDQERILDAIDAKQVTVRDALVELQALGLGQKYAQAVIDAARARRERVQRKLARGTEGGT